MSATERRAQIRAAAARAFAHDGYAGTSTDAVAKEAGVSQPYVVRMFGTKVELFNEVLDHSCAQIRETFSRVFDDLDAEGIDPASEEYRRRLGRAYGALVTDRNLLLVMMHGFIAGSTPEIGEHSRRNMSAIYELLRTRSGWTPEEARDFIAQGMLLNVLLGMQAPEHLHADPVLGELLTCSFGSELVDAIQARTTS